METNSFTLNGVNYDKSELPKEGQEVVDLLKEAQIELNKIETRRQLLHAAQQQLINELKPIIAEVEKLKGYTGITITGQASQKIPTTQVEIPEELPAPFPEEIPDSFKKEQTTRKGFS